MRTEPCKKCGSVNFYQKGKYYSCRPCHVEAQSRYVLNKKHGTPPETKGPPKTTLSKLLSKEKSEKLFCPKGHSLSGDNLYLSSYLATGYLRRRCRACDRNEHRVKYGVPVEPAPVKLADMFDL